MTFMDGDEPNAQSVRAHAALVLNPIVDGFRLTKVLMDGGSRLNLIYEDTLDKMQMYRSRLSKAIPPFEALSPVKKHGALGKLSWMWYSARPKTIDPKSCSFMWSPSIVGIMPSSSGTLSHAFKTYPITGI